MGDMTKSVKCEPIDTIVELWCESKGIKWNEVREYRIIRAAGHVPILELSLFFDFTDVAEITGLNSAEPEFIEKG